MEKYSIVQVVGPQLDPMYKGCFGIVLETDELSKKSTVGFYTPQESGKNAFVKRVPFFNSDLHDTGGKLKINPKP